MITLKNLKAYPCVMRKLETTPALVITLKHLAGITYFINFQKILPNERFKSQLFPRT